MNSVFVQGKLSLGRWCGWTRQIPTRPSLFQCLSLNFPMKENLWEEKEFILKSFEEGNGEKCFIKRFLSQREISCNKETTYSDQNLRILSSFFFAWINIERKVIKAKGRSVAAESILDVCLNVEITSVLQDLEWVCARVW